MKTNRLEVVNKNKQTNKRKELKGGATPPENLSCKHTTLVGFGRTMLGTNRVHNQQCWPFNEKFTLV